VIANLV